MAELHWFPIYYADWLTSPAIAAMLPEQEGAYVRLLMIAWGDGDVEPSLSANHVALSQMSRLGARWKKLGALVVEQFEERDGRLYHAKLSAVWRDQQDKHAAVVKKGRKGGEARAAKRKLGASAGDGPEGSSASSPATDLPHGSGGYPLAIENLEGAVEPTPPTGRGVLPAPAPVGALAPDGAALRASGARALYRPERSEQEKLLDAAYGAKLRERADAWFADHAPESSDMRLDALTAIGVSVDDDLKPWQERAAYAAMLDAYRARKNIPDCDTWVAQILAGTREWPAGVPRVESANAA